MILCCKCGIEILPNQRNMCDRCINNAIDLKVGISLTTLIETCRGCERYHVPPKSWKTLAWGSKDLLMFLLARNKSLKKLNIIDSNFIYSEQHSKRINVEITVLEDQIEQVCELEFTVRNRQCTDGMHAEAKQYWKALVQVRQKPHHRRTFMYIEQLILNHNAHMKTSNIKERKDGIDFYFSNRGDALSLVDFLAGFYGIRVTNSHQLISEDVRNNTSNKKFTFSVELLPFCRDDLVCFSDTKLGLGKFALVTKVGNAIVFMDPAKGRNNRLYSKQYFGNEGRFNILLRSDRFRRYRVIYARPYVDGIAEVTITEDDIVFHDVSTRLLVKDDDIVFGYDIANANLSEEIDMGTNILLVRVLRDDKVDMVDNSDRLLDSEFRLFVEDISKDKSMLSRLAISEAKENLPGDLASIHL